MGFSLDSTNILSTKLASWVGEASKWKWQGGNFADKVHRLRRAGLLE